MIEQEYIQYCLSEIEKKLGWQDSQHWKESDFKKLSEIITESSGTSISPHTLKRLFGKLKYNKYYNPQQATKNALATYLGFSEWDDLVSHFHNHQSEKKVIPDDRIPNERKGKRRFPLILFFFFLILLLIWGASNLFRNHADTNVPFSFGLVDSVGSVPFTVSVNFDLTKIKTDSTFIDFDFTHPFMGNQRIVPDKSRYSHNFTYQIPGYYQVELISDKTVLSTKSVLAMSGGWNSYFLVEAKMGRLWLDNEIPQHTPDGILYFSPSELAADGFDLMPVYYITNRLYKEFEIDGDNFIMETRFKNSKETGGITCYDSVFRLVCENNTNNILLMEEGCSQFSGIKFGETSLEGEYDDLSEFKLDTEDWNILVVRVKQQNVEVFINDKPVYQGRYSQPNGQLVGIESRFKGSGMMDYIRIQDANSGKIFFDDFD